MNTQDRKPGTGNSKTDNRDTNPLTESDLQKSERDLAPTKADKPFPESQMTKEQRKDAEKVQGEKHDDIEALANDVNGTVGSRQSGSSPEDIAGVADLDRGLRSRRNK